VVSLSAYIVAHPITRASTIASFFSLFSVVETGRNKAPLPFPRNSGAQGFRKPPGVVFFNLSLNFPQLFPQLFSPISFYPIVFPILNLLLILYTSPPISQKRERFPEPRKTSTRKKITDEFLETLFRR
jgi:hypothetical protein